MGRQDPPALAHHLPSLSRPPRCTRSYPRPISPRRRFSFDPRCIRRHAGPLGLWHALVRLLYPLDFQPTIAYLTPQLLSYSCYIYTRAHSKTNWWSFFLRASRQTPDDDSDGNNHMTMTHEHSHFVHLPHIIIVPSYKESETTLIQTLSVLASHPLAKYAYKVCLAMEERELGSLAKGEALKAQFQANFRSLTVTIHPAGIEGELSGKGSNVRWAARYMAERECVESDPHPQLPLASRVHPERIPDAVITVMDADTAFAGDYFLAVSAKYLLASPEKRRQMMFIPPLIFDRNQSDVPTVTRVTDIFWAAASVHFSFPFISLWKQCTHTIFAVALAAFTPPQVQSFQLPPIRSPSRSPYKLVSGMLVHRRLARTCICSASRCLTLVGMYVRPPLFSLHIE